MRWQAPPIHEASMESPMQQISYGSHSLSPYIICILVGNSSFNYPFLIISLVRTCWQIYNAHGVLWDRSPDLMISASVDHGIRYLYLISALSPTTHKVAQLDSLLILSTRQLDILIIMSFTDFISKAVWFHSRSHCVYIIGGTGTLRPGKDRNQEGRFIMHHYAVCLESVPRLQFPMKRFDTKKS
jgi:uncharacterized membrane protein SirB2